MKFFDSLDDIPTLVERAEETGFPRAQLALALIVHNSSRVVQVGGAIGKTINSLGRSIMAGCTTSASLARAYMRKPVDNVGNDDNHKLYEHVDDLAQLIVHKSPMTAKIIAIRQGIQMRKNLKEGKLTISGKSTVIANQAGMA